MSITHLPQSGSISLSAAMPVAQPLGTPHAATRVHAVERPDGVETGVWECSPGRWRRQIMQAEFCHFIQGRCRFIPDAGEAIDIAAGDAVYFPANSRGVWEVTETVRKSYVLLP
ncbi:nucleoside-diphosphate-sugar epimerases [Aquitalea magnusonii]|uniref:Nucleoside-diphosphate-sugar epimerases n=1 Tax=Aquitalea magnusonii TaxID=332411 RepID=A0A3G9GID0_9NEIS|nr:cupin domain-containing protein [Aquitalea magnusonii]BBF87648.1 nucleoside-diphosphate-sugar epimerases [Aquitalea magnusonii]